MRQAGELRGARPFHQAKLEGLGAVVCLGYLFTSMCIYADPLMSVIRYVKNSDATKRLAKVEFELFDYWVRIL